MLRTGCKVGLAASRARVIIVIAANREQVMEASALELVKGSAPAVKLDDKNYKLADKRQKNRA